MPKGVYARPDSVALFWAKVTTGEGCWEWHGARDRGGYGVVTRKRKMRKAHRVAFELANGPIPDGVMVCHHCDNPPCVRPDHLFLGTNSENQRDSVQKGRSIVTRPVPPKVVEKRLTTRHANKTHCVRGHPFDEANTRWKGTVRVCRACRVINARQYRTTAAYRNAHNARQALKRQH